MTTRSPPIGRQGKAPTTKIRPKAVIFGRLSVLYKCQPEIAGDVVSGMAGEYVGMDVRGVEFGDFRSNRSRCILAAHFVMEDVMNHVAQNAVHNFA